MTASRRTCASTSRTISPLPERTAPILGGPSPTPRYRLVADRIVGLILAGDLPPGAKMPADRDLVAALGVGRTTVREAMIALELMGYVVTRYGAGAYIADPLPERDAGAPSLPGFFELVEARAALEPEIAAAAAQVIGPAEIDALEACIEGMCDPLLPLRRTEAHDRDFHLVLARATDNSIFVSLIEEFWRVRQAFPEWTRLNNRQSAGDIARFWRSEHAAIVEALRHGDPTAARAAMQIHCRNSGRSLADHWREHDRAEGSPVRGTVAVRLFRERGGAT